METWITPALLVALAVGMIHSLRSDMEQRIDRVDQRMDRLETGLGEVKEGLAEVRGELSFVRDYTDRIDEDAGRHLQRLEPRPVLMRFGDTSVGEQRGRPRIMIAVGLENGVWAEFAVRPGYWPRASAVSWTTAP